MRNFGRWILAVCCIAVIGCGQDVKMVEVDPPSIILKKKDQSRKLVVVAKDIHDAEVPNIRFNFSSEDPSVATVDSGGVVKPAGNGSTAIIAKTDSGVTGETFIKVCLPKELVCAPDDLLNLKEGLAAPIKCHVTDCKDEKVNAAINYVAADTTMILKEGENVFIGLKIGDTTVKVTSLGLEKTVKVHVDEQTFLPGMEPGAGGGGGGGGGKKQGEKGPKGTFDHILDNMKF